MNFDIRYFMSICWRRLPLFIPVTLVFSVIAFVVAMNRRSSNRRPGF